jgi:hydroxymethylpyrimidine/phosphomethylpyrimidine kinase
MQIPTKPSLLSIAGFDPTGGAGILLDAAVFRSLGFHPLAVLTSVAAQGSQEVRAVEALPGDFIAEELAVLSRAFHPQAVKLGMLHHLEAVEEVGNYLARTDVPVVFDPVMKASSGGNLIVEDAFAELENIIIPRCRLVTPNLAEAEIFAGESIDGVASMRGAAGHLSKKWECAVLIKGGHLSDHPVDVLASQDGIREFSHEKISWGSTVRGTGCALSAAIMAGLAQKKPLEDAVAFGIRFAGNLIHNAYRCDQEDKAFFSGV